MRRIASIHHAELLGWHGVREGMEQVRLPASDARAHERGDVAVAAVLTLQVGVPEPTPAAQWARAASALRR